MTLSPPVHVLSQLVAIKSLLYEKKNPWLCLQCYNEGEFPQATATGNGLVQLSCPMVEHPTPPSAPIHQT